MNDVWFTGEYAFELSDASWALFGTRHLKTGSVEAGFELSFETERLLLVDEMRLTYAQGFDVSNPARALLQRISDSSGTSPSRPLPGRPELRSFAWLPENFWEEIYLIQETLDRKALRHLTVLLWRLGIHDGPSVLKSELARLRYRLPGGCDVELPVSRVASTTQNPIQPLSEEMITEALAFAASTGEPALHHTTFTEAWRQRNSQPRVSLLMAVVSVETAVKEYIAQQMPDTRWLMENLAAPPIPKIIREFLQTVPTRRTIGGKVVRTPKRVITSIQEAVELRNEIAHGRSFAITTDGLEATLADIRDFLAFIDFCSGQDWSLELMSSRFRSEIENASRSNLP